MNAVERYRQRRRNRLVQRMRSATSPDEARRLAIIIYAVCWPKIEAEDGGPGSGNHNHAGRPGEIGGSAPSGSSSSSASEAYKASLATEKEKLLSQDEAKQALTMWKKGYLSHDEAVDAMYDGSVSERVEEYYALMEENGNTVSDKPTTKENKNTRNQDVDSGKYASHEEACAGYVKETTGLTDDECKEIAAQATTWTSNQWSKADTETLDKFIENDHTYDGKIYRGLHLGEGDESTYDSFMENVKAGSVISTSKDGKNASWSSSEADATSFSHKSNSWEDSVVLKCVANRTSSPIAYLNNQGEKEVISHSKAQWTVLSVEETNKGNGGRHAVITVVERGSYKTDTNGDGVTVMDEKKTIDKNSEDTEFMPMLDRWEASSGDFVVEPPKKKGETDK